MTGFLIKPNNNGRVAIIDGDPIVYRIGFACQQKYYRLRYEDKLIQFDNKKDLNAFLKEVDEEIDYEEFIDVEPKQNAFHSVNLNIDNILSVTNSDNYEVYLTGKNNFREKVAKTHKYKGNRDKLHKPRLYDEIREFLINRHGAFVVDGIEADDICSIRLMELGDMGTLCSIDKDLDMIPGNHFDYRTGELYKVDEFEANFNFYKQMLTGDTTDNIHGIKGIGDKKAKKLLIGCETEEEMYEVVTEKYKEYFGEDSYEDRLAENGSLLWMMREKNNYEHPFTKTPLDWADTKT